MKKVVNIDQFRRQTDAPKAAQPDVNMEQSSSVAKAPESSKDNAAQKKACIESSVPLKTPAELPAKKLTKPAADFRQRFIAALDELKTEAMTELENATTSADIKMKINVSTVLKRAKASPLTAYSPLHREILLPLVEDASSMLNALAALKFRKSKKSRETISSLKEELATAKSTFEAALAKISSQKLSEYLKN